MTCAGCQKRKKTTTTVESWRKVAKQQLFIFGWQNFSIPLCRLHNFMGTSSIIQSTFSSLLSRQGKPLLHQRKKRHFMDDLVPSCGWWKRRRESGSVVVQWKSMCSLSFIRQPIHPRFSVYTFYLVVVFSSLSSCVHNRYYRRNVGGAASRSEWIFGLSSLTVINEI